MKTLVQADTCGEVPAHLHGHTRWRGCGTNSPSKVGAFGISQSLSSKPGLKVSSKIASGQNEAKREGLQPHS